jgi:cell division protein FtsB
MIPQDSKNTIIRRFNQLTDVRVLGLLAFGIIAVLITWSGLKVAKTNYDLEKKISQLEQRNSVEQLENDNLRLRNEYYKSGQYLELAVRSKFNKAASGEKLYLIPREVEMTNTLESPQQARKAKEERGNKPQPKYRQNFDTWMKFLFNAEPGS